MFKLFNKAQTGSKAKVKIDGMHCVSCSMSIDMALEEIKGVSKAETNYAKGESEVTYDPAVVSADSFVKAIAEQGYKAQIIEK